MCIAPELPFDPDDPMGKPNSYQGRLHNNVLRDLCGVFINIRV